jgi:hypothetical protein
VAGKVDPERIFDQALDSALTREEILAPLGRSEALRAGLDSAYLRLSAKRAAADLWPTARSERRKFLQFRRRGSRLATALAAYVAFGVGAYLYLRQTFFPNSYFPSWDSISQARTRSPDVLSVILIVTIAPTIVVLLRNAALVFPLFRPGSLKAAETNLENALLEKGILPHLRNILNEMLAPSYSRRLAIERAPGLSELFDPVYEISTEASTRLRRLVQQLPGGSIGISGPRGVGKSTLVRSLCSNPLSEEKGESEFAVMVSAPVEYTARDFLLYLFSSVCEAVIAATDTSRSKWGASSDIKNVFDYSRHRRWRRIAVVMGSGAALIASGLTLSKPIRETIASSDVIRWGANLLVAVGTSLIVLALFMLLRMIARLAPSGRPLSSLRPTALRWMHDIKFQQSFSSGWSGALKLPLGLESSVTGTTTLAQMQMSFPDIVGGFRDFLGQVAAQRRVIIGIDELDKINSDDKARQFLNEVKAIFGIEHCYYIISVSEDAMASFERRGIPFRDVFDSSFDEIVKVGYFSFADAKRLLSRRIVRLPIPFVALCYCLSGGLARDLIRAARNLIDVGHTVDTPRLTPICRKLIQEDLQGKTEAVLTAVKPIELEPEVTELMRWFRGLDVAKLTANGLLEHCRWLEVDEQFKHAASVHADSSSVDRRNLFRLVRELVGFYYYCATLLEFFDDQLTKPRLQRAEASNFKTSSLDYLAKSRQAFSINATIAWTSVSDFRVAWGFEEVAFPQVLVA